MLYNEILEIYTNSDLAVFYKALNGQETIDIKKDDLQKFYTLLDSYELRWFALSILHKVKDLDKSRALKFSLNNITSHALDSYYGIKYCHPLVKTFGYIEVESRLLDRLSLTSRIENRTAIVHNLFILISGVRLNFSVDNKGILEISPMDNFDQINIVDYNNMRFRRIKILIDLILQPDLLTIDYYEFKAKCASILPFDKNLYPIELRDDYSRCCYVLEKVAKKVKVDFWNRNRYPII